MVGRETDNGGNISRLTFLSFGYCCYPFYFSGQTALEDLLLVKYLERVFLVLLVFLLLLFVNQMELSK